MSVREKIVYNVDAFISEMKENEQKEKLAETEKAHVQKKEESAISKIKNTALGALIDLTPITSEDNEDDDNGNVGKGVSLKTKNRHLSHGSVVSSKANLTTPTAVTFSNTNKVFAKMVKKNRCKGKTFDGCAQRA